MTAIPQTAAELEEVLNDPKQVGQIFAKKGTRDEFLKAYAEKVHGSDPNLSAQVKEQLQMGLADLMGTKGTPKVDLSANGRPEIAGMAQSNDPYFKIRRNGLYNKAAMGSGEIDTLFNSQSDYFRALALQGGSINRLSNGVDLLKRLDRVAELQNTYGTDAPSDGGFLIPEVLRSDLLMIALESAVIRPRATVIPMGVQRVGIPAVDATSNVTTVFGGIQTYWVDEATAPTESSGKFQQVWLDAKKLMAYLTAPNELIADANAFGAYLEATLPQAIAFEEDYRFMQGNGSGQPLGYVNCNAAVTATAVSGQGANTIVVDNLAAMYARLFPSSMGRAIWVASIDTFPQLATMAVSGAVGNSNPVWFTANAPGVPGIVNAPPVSIYGRPVYFTEKHPTLGTAGDIMLIDPSFYLVGDRQAMEVSASPHFLFSTDKTAYRVVERVDGRPWLQSAITPKNGGNTLSAFVELSGTRT